MTLRLAREEGALRRVCLASDTPTATGTIAVGQPADLVVCDAPVGSSARDALGATARGDIPGISCIVIDGVVRVGPIRNTPLAQRLASVTCDGARRRALIARQCSTVRAAAA